MTAFRKSTQSSDDDPHDADLGEDVETEILNASERFERYMAAIERRAKERPHRNRWKSASRTRRIAP